MLSEKNILELETRRHIYNTILKYPGLHLRELSRKTNISFGGLRHHLKSLEKRELIIIKADKRFKRYYINKVISNNDKELYNILRQEIPRKIVLLLLIAGPAELYRDYNTDEPLDPNLFSLTHSKKELEKLTKYWKKPYDEKFHLKKHRTTMDFHLKKLLDAGIIEKVKIGKEIKYRLKDEFEIWYFLINNKKSISDKLVNDMLGWYGHSVDLAIDRVINVFYEILPNPFYM